MQLATTGPETGFMYKELTFRSVSKPGRITVPGFVLPAPKALCFRRRRRRYGIAQIMTFRAR
jgi:hypothetical protein